MSDSPNEAELEALAALLGDIAEDVGPHVSEEELPPNLNVAESLMAVRDADGAPSAGRTRPRAPPEAEQSRDESLDPRAANAAKARLARAEKRRKLEADKKARGAAAADHDTSAVVPSLGSAVIVPSGTLEAIRQGLMWPLGGPHLQAPVNAALRIAEPANFNVDREVAKLVDRFCLEGEGKIETKAAQAEALDMTTKAVDKLVPLLSNSILVLEQITRGKVEAALTQGARPLVYVDAMRYDETPMAATARHVMHSLRRKSGPPGSNLQPNSTVQTVVLGSDQGVRKLFQTESVFAALVRVVDPPPGMPSMIGIRGDCITGIQEIAANTAEVYKRAISAASRPSSHSTTCTLPIRMATSDKHASNVKAEGDVVKERGPTWSSIWHPCDIHTAAGNHTKTSVLVKDDISALVHLSLSLCDGGHMRTFRECILADVAHRLVFLHGSRSPEATDYRDRTLSLFMARGPDVQARKAMLQVYLTGDWRDHDKIHYHYQSPGIDDQLDEEALREIISVGVVQCLANTRLRTYPHHRWVGFDLSLDQLGLMEAVHGILHHAFRRFCLTFPQRVRKTQVSMDAGQEQQPPTDVVLEEERGGLVEHDRGVGSDVPEPNQCAIWAEQNQKHRRIAADYMASEPLGRLVLLRRIFEPFRRMLYTLIHMGSDSWEKEQAAREARRLNGDGNAPPRTFRILVAALQEVENEFMEGIKSIANPDAWKDLPISESNMVMRNLAFRLMSRAGATTEAMLRVPHDTFPTKLFTILEDPDLGSFFTENIADCCLGPFARNFIAKFPLDQGDSYEALRFLASLLHTDISQIEQRHAALRQRLHVMAPTHKPSTGDLSSYWTFRQYRLRQNSSDVKKGKKSGGRKAKRTKLVKGKVKATMGRANPGTGGAWRYFIHLKTRGSQTRPDLAALAAEFRQSTPAQMAEYRKAGARGTKVGRRTKMAFGHQPRAIRRRATRAAMRQIALRIVSGQGRSVPGQPLVSNELVLTGSNVADTSDVARLARAERAQQNSIVVAGKQSDADAIDAFQSGLGDVWRTTILRQMPGLESSGITLKPWPDSKLAMLHVQPNTADLAKKVVSYAIQNSKVSNLEAALDMDWNQRTQAISGGAADGSCGSIEDASAGDAGTRSLCQEHGVCLCCPAGKLIQRMSEKFLSCFKPVVKRGTQGRVDMVSSRLVLRLHWREVRNEAPLAGMGGNAIAPLQEPLAEGDEYWHVAWTCLSPYRPTFQFLEWRSSDGMTTELRATWRFASFMRAIESLDREHAWSMHFLRLHETFEPITRFDPSIVLVRDFGASVGTFWDPAKKPRARRQPRPKAAVDVGAGQSGAGGALADTEADASVEDNGGDGGESQEELGEDSIGEAGRMDADDDDDAREEDRLEQMLEELLLDVEIANRNEEANMGATEGPERTPMPPAPQPPTEAPVVDRGARGPSSSGAASSGFQNPAAGRRSVKVAFHGGKIEYFFKDRRFQATCPNRAHGRCVLTRSGSRKTSQVGGRPMGELAFWVKNCCQKTQVEHVYAPTPTFADRLACRAELQAVPEAAALFANEHPPDEGEGIEPLRSE